ncbi:hypothetical protein Ciccas_002975 [Cichlidogyrus casuarinus]|uniref:Uncharacterized protein n=1 Tax=Cichlidogyrus casuarinus TaxID=1844966 RepID=A0ABD2QFN6_9PLAT
MTSQLLNETTYDGGACNPTTWRKDTAIPLCNELNLLHYNPQQDFWHPGLVECERIAKQNSKFLLFVFDFTKTRGLASLVEVGYLIGESRAVVIVLPNLEEASSFIFTQQEMPQIKRALDYLKYLSQSNVKLTTSLVTALDYIHENRSTAAYVIGKGYPTVLMVEMMQKECNTPDSGIEVEISNCNTICNGSIPSEALPDYNRARHYLLQIAKESPNAQISDTAQHSIQICRGLLSSESI